MRRVAGSRKIANRHGRGEHLLDVRVRRSTARRQRRHRTLRAIVSVVFWVGLAVGTGFGFHAIINKFFLQNPEYNLRVVDTDLDGLMSRDEAVRLAGLQLGTNIFRVDLGAAEHAFQQIDQIDTITIQRDWPDHVTIRLTRRIPIAWLARSGSADLSADRSLLLDADGRTMKPYRIEPEYWRLPVIYAVDPGLIQKGDILAVADLKAALDLLAERRHRDKSLFDIQSIDISKGYMLEVTDSAKTLYQFAPGEPGPQLDRLEKLLVNCHNTGRKLESVNLISKRNTAVRFVPVASPTPTPAAVVKTPRKVK